MFFEVLISAKRLCFFPNPAYGSGSRIPIVQHVPNPIAQHGWDQRSSCTAVMNLGVERCRDWRGELKHDLNICLYWLCIIYEYMSWIINELNIIKWCIVARWCCGSPGLFGTSNIFQPGFLQFINPLPSCSSSCGGWVRSVANNKVKWEPLAIALCTACINLKASTKESKASPSAK